MPVPAWFAELLERELGAWMHLTREQVSALYQHYELLLKWNQRLNLTTVKPGPEMVIRHYCESLFFALKFPAAESDTKILDFGSGAGFPGFPMAVYNIHWKMTLLESHQRKTVFLRETSREIANLSVLAQRGEQVLGAYTWIVSRAVDPGEVLSHAIRLGSNVGLLLGDEDFSRIEGHPGIAWGAPVRLPWGDRRLIVFGYVPRGT